MAPKTLPSRDLVQQMLRYDADTGEFVWQVRPREHFKRDSIWRMWNIQNAGKPAGHINAAGYRVIGRGYFRAQRLAWLFVHGEPVPAIIDHIDGDRLNNSIGNLRAATNADNGANSKTWRNNRSGIKGVFLSRRGYRAYICRDGKRYILGVFPSLEEAAAARREAATRLQGEFARHD